MVSVSPVVGGGSITAKQAGLVRGNLPVIQRRSVLQNQMARKEFVGGQNYLMKRWEANTSRAWPSDATPHHCSVGERRC